ncbi:hypothetical protein A8C56_18810 [Niabella ginsenosidivorans]|uniref:Uncharacterized protein n=1 Tax=Niabella ginsenosidivorans TaxID=1176587 RepID=A0A1A9I5Y5_9BACT|nr:hypothetical protein A8C56_18810 [Niabella ginsenosidivorans]
MPIKHNCFITNHFTRTTSQTAAFYVLLFIDEKRQEKTKIVCMGFNFLSTFFLVKPGFLPL